MYSLYYTFFCVICGWYLLFKKPFVWYNKPMGNMYYNLDSLNKEQLLPTLDTEGIVIVTAGAGSGKTRVLTHRIFHLILDKSVNPENILAITFTNKATNELKERLSSINTVGSVWVSTFHSMCAKILRESISHLDGFNRFFTIYDTDDQDKVLKKIIKQLNPNVLDEDFKKTVSYHISRAKNEGLEPDEYRKFNLVVSNIDEICNVYSAYQAELKTNNALDFDDLLLRTLQLFKSNPNVLNYYSNKFRYIHVDEFQDTNTVQYKLIKLLSSVHKNLFVVGDEDQSIYSWRGANIENLKNLMLDFPDAKYYKLEQNYRSTKNILKISNRLIKNNTSRIEKELWTENETGEEVIYHSAYDEKDEAEYISRQISNLIYSGKYNYSDIAILSRVNALTYNFEERLLNYNIPYTVYGNFKFFERAEIKNVLSYLKVFVNNADNASLSRVINIPRRGIGQASIDKLLLLCKELNVSLFELILNVEKYHIQGALLTKLKPLSDLLAELNSQYSNSGLYEFAKAVVDMSDIKSEYAERTEENDNRKLNIETLLQSIKSFEENNPTATLSSYLESVTLENEIDSENSDDGNSVVLSTVHACKGLEFRVVFIVGAEDGLFPLQRSLDNILDLEEDRRLMYVAVTRAKEKVYITRAKSRFLYGSRHYTIESRFVKEMGLIIPTMQKPVQSFNSGDSIGIYGEGNNSFVSTKGGFNYNSYMPKTTTSTNVNQTKVDKYFENNKSSNNFSDYKVGTMVSHVKFGIGTIIKVENIGDNSFVSVDFGTIGVKTLSLAFAPLKILKK